MRTRSRMTWAVVIGYTAITLGCAWGLIVCIGERCAHVTFLHIHAKESEPQAGGVSIAYSDTTPDFAPWHVRCSWHIHVSFDDSEPGKASQVIASPDVSAVSLSSTQVGYDAGTDPRSSDRRRVPPPFLEGVHAAMRATVLLI